MIYTAEKLVAIEALPAAANAGEVESEEVCELCRGDSVAMWRVALQTPQTLMQPSRLRKDVLACKLCFPVRAACVLLLASPHDCFTVLKRSARLQYASLIDSSHKNMSLVLHDSHLHDIYQRAYNLGETLGKGDLDYFWMRMNQHFAKQTPKLNY